MKTRNVDLAAYLYLMAVQPTRVTRDSEGLVIFEYPDSEYVRAGIDAYQNDGMAPVRAFCEARAVLKAWDRGGQHRAHGNYQKAVDATRRLS